MCDCGCMGCGYVADGAVRPCKRYIPDDDPKIPTDSDGSQICVCGWGRAMHKEAYSKGVLAGRGPVRARVHKLFLSCAKDWTEKGLLEAVDGLHTMARELGWDDTVKRLQKVAEEYYGRRS